MKIYELFVLLLFATSCELVDESGQPIQAVPRSAGTAYQFIGGDGYLLLLKQSGSAHDTSYFLQRSGSDHFQENLEVSSVVTDEFGLTILLTDGSTRRADLAGNPSAQYHGYGLSELYGDYYFRKFYGPNGPLADPDVSSVRCRCYANGTQTSCDAGGPGSDRCEISGSGSGGGSSVGMRCSVKCATGFFSCCRTI